jgi:glyoxylase-like metal-dependent hydrolase (beta-lactamase superfamily II)/rhodanese-related sulfurtransferase
MNMTQPIVKTLNDSGCFSYLIGCPNTRLALLVDPKIERRADYQMLLDEYQLHLHAVIDTHTHADHLSDSVTYLQQGIELWMSRHSRCKRPYQAVREGDDLEIGQLKFRVVEVPGHTEDSIALVGQGLAITGDSLFIGGLARADFRGSDPVELFESVQSKLMSLPEETLVFPGHGYNNILFSTIGQERQSNPVFKHTSGVSYAQELQAVEGRGNTPAVDATLDMNLEAAPELPESPGVAAACCAAGATPGQGPKITETTPEEIRPQLEDVIQQGRWIDVRDPYEFQAGRIPGTQNIPMSELGFHLDRLRTLDSVVLSCRSGVRSLTAARTLQHLGVSTDPISVAGGILRWQELELPMEGVAS